ncbi:hypothetical protein LEP1GSC103_2318 [Leptospira borgpetersenii serovar Javanica str. UI 09931]|uniref:Uncharacterized protein n=5 Tax=Leptospira borgpetersenii TaxID=174 RepID=M3F7S7_LEPBO|nr:hypothetical protein LBBP_03829 [Leptospira borgpetersenii serovar Ballum]AXX16911.1 hypothetical protein C4Q31_16580 [Leptospira borgpetersenii serovar Ceylonica]EKP13313.1 hypothetical protein LEP1GSC128_3832 [Leptospira borgpetersenii str. 200801926]EKR00917.1 hypothetical protein LEP1GSC121_0085 [Leptospira borgpetersenii serovar Castellonis str. 200801910]EMF97987.1 hypothetical protein LEP1GSC123_1857 [Leptospira borgpetersenii str. 200701203]EMK09246.1 hypothetical protein LEP1GSC066
MCDLMLSVQNLSLFSTLHRIYVKYYPRFNFWENEEMKFFIFLCFHKDGGSIQDNQYGFK